MVYMSTSTRTRKIRAGLYEITAGNRTLNVEQIRTEIPGYGVENLWRITEADDLGRVHFDPCYTKAQAVAAINFASQNGAI